MSQLNNIFVIDDSITVIKTVEKHLKELDVNVHSFTDAKTALAELTNIQPDLILLDYFMPEMNPLMIYRLDRFGRGGHHRPFNDQGYAGVRIMEAHENYIMQHNDIRIENGIAYGDVIEGVNFEYAKKLTAVNAINLASIGWSPPALKKLSIGGIVEASVKFKWKKIENSKIAGYKIYWRDTTSPTWDYSKYVGDVSEAVLEGIVIDNFFFGVSTVGKNGFESPIVFPNSIFRD